MPQHNFTNDNASCIRHQTSSESQQPIAAESASDFPNPSPMKPLRPLTAYHIFFQIEREYIIQTTPGADADSSIHDHKFYLPDVPRRYRSIKLAKDWYAGPGKRAKRKHRKSHGKIGFLELSRVVSQRWSNLGNVDPETKMFVIRIAKRELDQYKREMKQYEALVKSTNGKVDDADDIDKTAKTANASTKTPSSTKRVAKKASNSLPSLPAVSPTPEVSTTLTCEQPHQSYPSHRTLITPPATPPPTELFFASEFDIISVFNDVIPESTFSSELSMASPSLPDFPDNDVDYSISYLDNRGHHIPSPSPSVCGERKRCLSEESICDPLFELEAGGSDELLEDSVKRRRLSCTSIGGFDREFYTLWSQ
ncbi:hypothetical protein ACHAW6_006287 [Cyclotella cf. meneghiniana]